MAILLDLFGHCFSFPSSGGGVAVWHEQWKRASIIHIVFHEVGRYLNDVHSTPGTCIWYVSCYDDATQASYHGIWAIPNVGVCKLYSARD